MNLPPLGSDPMDIYSKPLSQEKTKLATIFHLNQRKLPEKPGRSLTVVWDQRCSLVEGFENNYQYLVSFDTKGKKAGNHYHNSKLELHIPVIGEFTLLLENVETKEKEKIHLNAQNPVIIYIPPKIAHTVVSDSDVCTLLVIASFPNNLMDEFPYQIDL